MMKNPDTADESVRCHVILICVRLGYFKDKLLCICKSCRLFKCAFVLTYRKALYN